MDSGVRSSYATPLGLITIRSAPPGPAPGTRAEMLPDVQATRLFSTSAACSVQTSLRAREMAALWA